MSRRDMVLLGFVNAAWVSVLVLIGGPTFLRPLPTWPKLVVAAASAILVATLAIYSRRRAGLWVRTPEPPASRL